MILKKPAETPLMKQYNAIKAKYPDALLLFRVGDFYETFGEDAIKASKILDIVLTKRANGAASHIELAGFPHHALDNYLSKLVRAGNRVAICDQLEDPKLVKGIVKRGVTELVTPGLSFDDNVLEQRKNNYLAAIHIGDTCGIALLDLSTGEFLLSSGTVENIDKIIQSFLPSEIIFSKEQKKYVQDKYEEFSSFALESWVFKSEYAYEKLTRFFNVINLKGFGVDEQTSGIIAAGAVLYYLEATEHRQTSHINAVARLDLEEYVWLDKFTIHNLELLNSIGGASLLETINYTLTPMGGRMLRKWIVFPLKDKIKIQQRLSIVETLIKDETLQKKITSDIKDMGDLERLAGKIATSRVNPREMLKLKHSLVKIGTLKHSLSSEEAFLGMYDLLNKCDALSKKLSTHLNEEVPLLITQGNVIVEGINDTLDELRDISNSGKEFLRGIREREIEKTNISSLKIAYNRVFGYYLEVSNVHKDKVPDSWIRKQTLVNAERYITPELKEYEEKILTADAEIIRIEQQIFSEIISFSHTYLEALRQNAQVVAQIDCLMSFALIAQKHQYCLPIIAEDERIDIKEGRHPVIETHLPSSESFVPNDVYLDNQTQQILVITGPNMSGKSALLRQTALIILMAQMGSFVPATYAHIGITDKIFTRVGASDNLSKGESTFMVEMSETSSILHNLSSRSIVLMDEIGRGTSTYDGISIAWAIVEYLHNHGQYRAKTLFATHYHELNQIEKKLPRVKNFNVSVKELKDKIIFTRKLKVGGSEHSFGIHVAQMAGIPNEIVLRAHDMLKTLEKDKVQGGKKQTYQPPSIQKTLFREENQELLTLQRLINEIDINAISPVEALLKLNELKDEVKKK